MVVPKNVKLWKMMWDYVLNDETFRTQFGTSLYIGHSEDEGHFVSYEVRDGITYVFDPAGPPNRYHR